MIRYPIRPATWRNLIESVSPGFLERASERTARFRALRRYEENRGIWSQVKRAYMELQGFKCGFCERRLEKSAFGNIEHDVEHFRPKSRVTQWPTPTVERERGLTYTLNLGRSADPGYYLLAYHIENYLIACKTCNSALKRDCFPVGDNRLTGRDTPRDMDGERPFLIYPLGAVDQDPEDIITFEGIVPVPVTAHGRRHNRAIITIDFFALDQREVLLEERSETLLALLIAMNSLNHADPGTQAAAEMLVARMVDRRSPHANCARSFHDLFLSNEGRAEQFAQAALEYLVSLERD